MFQKKGGAKMLKVVLVVDDLESMHNWLKGTIGDKVELLSALTLKQGEKLFQENPDVDLIIMDACVPGDTPNSMELVRKIIASGYKKPILACSSMYSQVLMEVGATHKCDDKLKAPEIVLKLLGL